MLFFKSLFKPTFFTGCIPDPVDNRDFQYETIMAGEVDWEKGYDVEKDLGVTIPIKNQGSSSSCVGQGVSYYVGVLNAKEVGFYDENSAKAIYSQIFLSSGGAYIRNGMKLIVDWGSVCELLVSSYNGKNTPDESFMRDKTWKNENIDSLAKVMQAKEYRVINSIDMNTFAMAIKNNYGIVGGVLGENNSSWNTGEPKPPTNGVWAHCLYYGKFGVDKLGKYIATPNSWGQRVKDELHPDGWQKLREDYFKDNIQFNPWTLVDKPNYMMSEQTKKIMEENEKKIVVEGEGIGRKGIIINGKLREIKKDRVGEACLYTLVNNEVNNIPKRFGLTVSTQIFNEMEKDINF